MWNKSLLQAIEVSKLVEKLLPKTMSSDKILEHPEKYETEEYYYIEAFQNCREQGITIWIPNCKNKNINITFYVTQHRNCDEIGFYKGSHTFHGLAQDAYKEGFNGCGNIDKCASIIAKQILEMFK